MGLREKLLDETYGKRLQFEKPKGRFRVHPGDIFYGTFHSLLESGREYSITFDDSQKVLENCIGFVPDLLEEDALGLMKDISLSHGELYQFRIKEIINSDFSDIHQLFEAEMMRPTPWAAAVNYFTVPGEKFPQKNESINRYKKIPPYPEGFCMPENIKKLWMSGTDINGKIHFPILNGSPKEIAIGDQFNAILMAAKGFFNDFRIFQFRPAGFLGYVREGKNFEISSRKTFSRFYLHPALVYRFEITALFNQTPEKIFYVRAIDVDFRKGDFKEGDKNVEFNLTNVNYLRFR